MSASASLDINELERLLAKATPGPWEDDHEKNEGSYGEGWNIHEGYNSAVILGPNGKRLFDALNSDAAYIHEDAGSDEDGPYHSAWDETSIRNAELIVAAVNGLPTLIAAFKKVGELEAEVERLKLDDVIKSNALASAQVESKIFAALQNDDWFTEIAELLDQYQDAEIINGTTHPNKAMRLLNKLTELGL